MTIQIKQAVYIETGKFIKPKDGLNSRNWQTETQDLL